MPGRNVLVAFGPGQSSQQSSTSINPQDSQILIFRKQVFKIYLWKYIKITERLNKIRYLADFRWTNFFWDQTFSNQKVHDFTSFVLERKGMERWSLRWNCKSEQSRTSITFLTVMDFIKIFGKSNGWKTIDRLAHEFYEFIDIELMHC